MCVLFKLTHPAAGKQKARLPTLMVFPTQCNERQHSRYKSTKKKSKLSQKHYDITMKHYAVSYR